MYLADFTLYFIEATNGKMTLADFTIWQVEATTAKSVGRSPHTAVTT